MLIWLTFDPNPNPNPNHSRVRDVEFSAECLALAGPDQAMGASQNVSEADARAEEASSIARALLESVRAYAAAGGYTVLGRGGEGGERESTSRRQGLSAAALAALPSCAMSELRSQRRQRRAEKKEEEKEKEKEKEMKEVAGEEKREREREWEGEGEREWEGEGEGEGEEDEVCAICLVRFRMQDDVRVLGICEHVFHLGCIDQWLTLSATCPYCKRDVGGAGAGAGVFSSSPSPPGAPRG